MRVWSFTLRRNVCFSLVRLYFFSLFIYDYEIKKTLVKLKCANCENQIQI